jgi:hypothetical protein
MNHPYNKLAAVGNVYVRLMEFRKAGDVEQGHVHNFDHSTLLAHGSVMIRAKGKETVFKAPMLIWINKDVEHELTALEDNTICACIHALRHMDGEIIDPESIPKGAEIDYKPETGIAHF